ncbi:MAG: B12-binding domain-containing radical SAM protein [Nitrospiraceae bacterium]|nr:B12-binding domain-containing radical SAM protein [Nitrospiraceae bacterium]
MHDAHPEHSLGTKAKVLLTSVFGPYAQDDEYGSRTMNPMELYHNQVTRVQGTFSLRMFHRSFGLMLIQANLDAPCTLLDFPTQDRFIDEIKVKEYDIIGISAIMPNIGKVERMCALIREYQPGATIVVGGHIANLDDIETRIDADHVVKGDGVRWFRTYLGQETDVPVRHPLAISGFGTRILGVNAPDKTGDTAAVLIPSVGCPVGCNFCSTSAMFGGKGGGTNFYETGDALFTVMSKLEEQLKVKSFFTLDENFLFHKKRALRLLELMKEHNKSWALYVFSSARVLKSYTIDQLVGLGISWVWMGLEGRDSQYGKLSGVDTPALVREYEQHGIRILGSTIIGLEDHRPENYDEIIDWAVSHDTVFHQFMLYTAVSGTPLHRQHQADGTLLSEEEIPLADTHGQDRFNYRHKHIPAGEEARLIVRAFQRDFEVNGPSLLRLFRVTLAGLSQYKDHPEARIRERFRREAQSLRGSYAAAAWAMRRWYRKDRRIRDKADAVLRDIYKQFGWRPRLIAPVLGRIVSFSMKREAKRLARGWTYEPETHYEYNARAAEMEHDEKTTPGSLIPELEWVTCEPLPACD